MRKRIFTLFIFGLIVFLNSPVSARTFGIYAEKPAYIIQGELFATPSLDSADIVTENEAIFAHNTSGHPDSVYFGNNALHVMFAGKIIQL